MWLLPALCVVKVKHTYPGAQREVFIFIMFVLFLFPILMPGLSWDLLVGLHGGDAMSCTMLDKCIGRKWREERKALC